MSEEVIEGYKITEIGLLPGDWRIDKIGEVSEMIMGQSPPSSTYNDLGKGMPFLQGKAEFQEKYPKYIKSTTRPLKVAPKGSVLISVRAPVGDVNIANLDYCIGRGLASLSLRNGCDDFLFYLLIYSKPSIEKEGTGSTFKAVSKQKLASIRIPLPPLREQQKIASVLSTIQEGKEKIENVINALKDLKKSMMKHLFTYGPVPVDDAEKVPLKETEIGMIPEHWDLDCLGNLVDVRGGKRLPKGHSFAEDVTPFPYIRIVDFAKSSVRLSNLKYLTQMDRETIKRYIIEKEDIYISIAGTIGLVGTVPKELDGANLTENAARLILRDSKQINKIYLVDFLASECSQNEIHKRATKTSQPKLALTRIKEIPVAIPSYAEQQQIADILSAMDNKIEAEENKKQALDALFKTLLSLLMTGKIRVKDLEIPA